MEGFRLLLEGNYQVAKVTERERVGDGGGAVDSKPDCWVSGYVITGLVRMHTFLLLDDFPIGVSDCAFIT